MARPNFFIGARVKDLNLKSLIVQVQNDIVSVSPDFKRYVTSADKLHFTGFVMHLSNDQIAPAVECMKRCTAVVEQFYERFCVRAEIRSQVFSRVIPFVVEGFGTFKKDVLFLKPQEESLSTQANQENSCVISALRVVFQHIYDEFRASGLLCPLNVPMINDGEVLDSGSGSTTACDGDNAAKTGIDVSVDSGSGNARGCKNKSGCRTLVPFVAHMTIAKTSKSKGKVKRKEKSEKPNEYQAGASLSTSSTVSSVSSSQLKRPGIYKQDYEHYNPLFTGITAYFVVDEGTVSDECIHNGNSFGRRGMFDLLSMMDPPASDGYYASYCTI